MREQKRKTLRLRFFFPFALLPCLTHTQKNRTSSLLFSHLHLLPLRCRRAGPRSAVVSAVVDQTQPPSPPPAADQVKTDWKWRERPTINGQIDRRLAAVAQRLLLFRLFLTASSSSSSLHLSKPQRQQPRWQQVAWSPSLRASVRGPRSLLFSSVSFLFLDFRLSFFFDCFLSRFLALLRPLSASSFLLFLRKAISNNAEMPLVYLKLTETGEIDTNSKKQ